MLYFRLGTKFKKKIFVARPVPNTYFTLTILRPCKIMLSVGKVVVLAGFFLQYLANNFAHLGQKFYWKFFFCQNPFSAISRLKKVLISPHDFLAASLKKVLLLINSN